MTKGRVFLVGAGCGNADLITVRGQRLIQQCDVLVYDDLISPELLELAPENAEKIYMGKRSGAHAAAQGDINKMLVSKACEGKNVVRLKGGDPFVFGRGGEEIEALQLADIEYEEVPGISSSVAIPAAAGIPVTHRGLSRSFHVITAHTKDTEDALPEYMDKLAVLPGTLVFLMGLSRLELIAKRLIDGGMDPSTPAAVISGGNSPNPAAVRGILSDIAEKTRAAAVRSPAVIVVGQTAALDFSATVSYPLSGIKVGLTGTDYMTGRLRPLLEKLGADVHTLQRSRICEFEGCLDLRRLSGQKSVVVFTSSNGVRMFFRELVRQKVDIRTLSGIRFAVIGAATGRLLSEYGIQPDLCPEKYTGKALGELLLKELEPGEKVCLYRSAMATDELYTALADKYDVEDIDAYTVKSDEAVAAAARDKLSEMDYLCFSSAAGVELFYSEQNCVPENVRCVCIGEVTAAALRRHADRPFLCADEISAEGMVQTIMNDIALR